MDSPAPARPIVNDAAGLIAPRRRRRTRIGLVAGGLGTYWPQFPGLRPQLEESARYVSERFQEMDAEVTDAGFISDAQDGARAAEALRKADCDLIVLFLTTYLTASMVLPIAQRSHAPVLVIDLQPTEKMGHATFDTGNWLAYCGQCPVPELGNVFRRAGIPFRSVSGWLRQEPAWQRIEHWVNAAHVREALRHARHGLMGHLYPGMLDVSTDPTMLSAAFGSHVEVVEFDDLRVRVDHAADADVRERTAAVREIFTIDPSVDADDLEWGVRVSLGLDRLVDDFELDSLAYYHRGLDQEIHERLGAGMILGASLLTARGVPTTGEYELRTSVAQLITQTVGAGGSFCEIQALNFEDGVVEMGHDGPAHITVSNPGSAASRPRCLPRQARLGRQRRVRRSGTVRSPCSGSDRTRTEHCPSLRRREAPYRDHCSRSATPRAVSTSQRDPGEWVDEWIRQGSATTGLCPSDDHGFRTTARRPSLLGIEFRQV